MSVPAVERGVSGKPTDHHYHHDHHITVIIISSSSMYLSTVSLNMLGMEMGGLLWGPDSCIGILTAPSGVHDLENNTD